ncbi:hypothetical protein [Peribacillus glennii]|uniref:Uncharacterized protein n=1 Tax=Peribacillus glennii TaxID=2303991 RepID=A0A372LHN7_9BACI|nr:hypothetical protein [Peribacillus glennii]RFU65817.1 hypothetical protein D0466_08090 [Peribacillus glennii]
MKVKRRHKQLLLFLVISIAIILFIRVFLLFENGPEDVVEEFYGYEAEGEFGQLWDLFHSGMKEKFPNKADYIQNRAHVFMQHMEVETFGFEIGDSQKHKTWKVKDGSETLKNVYEVSVTQTFNSRFGKFSIQQSCFVAKEKGEWKILWDYNY